MERIKISSKSLAELRAKTFAYLRRWRAAGGLVTQWLCPACGEHNDTPRPRRSDVDDRGQWDSLKTCLHCGEVTMVVVYPSGKTAALQPTGAA